MSFFREQSFKGGPKVLIVTLEYRKTVFGEIARVVNGLVDKLCGKLSFDIFLFPPRSRPLGPSGILCDDRGVVKEQYWRDTFETVSRIIERHGYDIVHLLNPRLDLEDDVIRNVGSFIS